MSIATLLIEKDPKSDTRFRITVCESILRKTTIPAVDVRIYDLQHIINKMKIGLAIQATNLIRPLPVHAWILAYGGRTIIKRTCYKPTGNPNADYRAGISITFKDRDKAMLFKLTWINAPATAPLAFAA
ncbi:hypothetical protein QP179_03300 [Sphingomonas aurantiaca]|uniref:hypothetical protein n=1 Tax=Sphingomonas aurantiaca TaxID=185949 RepID=UPI002FE3276C